MKAVLEFNLPEEKHEFDNATQGATMRYILYKHFEYLRGKLKHGELSQMNNTKLTRIAEII
jgi:hypothetical protein